MSGWALPRIVAHRGGAREAPENTLAAFAHAVACGADGVELDVRSTADGVAVVFHDDDLRRFDRGAGRVEELTARELRSIDLGRRHRRFRGARVPTLAEALAATAPLAFVNLELKPGGDPARLAAAAVAAIADAASGARLLVTSFAAAPLAALAALRPDLPRGLVLDRPPPDDAWLAHSAVSLSLELARHGFAQRAREAGLRLLVWTENDPRRLAAWARRGVEAVITDRPARFVRARAELRRGAAQSPSGRRV